MTQPQLAVQVYSLREAHEADLEATYERIAKEGIAHVELFRLRENVERTQAALKANGLTACSAHAQFLSEGPDLETQSFEAAAALGAGVLIDPRGPEEIWLDRGEIVRLADRLNAAAVRAAEFGLRVGYHNHGHEVRTDFDGRTGLEIFADELAPEVAMEVDLYWTAVGSDRAVEIVGNLGERIEFTHIKDGDIAAGRAYAGGAPKPQPPAGEGDVPLDALLAAIPSQRFAVIEYDLADRDPFEAVVRSAQWLRERGIS